MVVEETTQEVLPPTISDAVLLFLIIALPTAKLEALRPFMTAWNVKFLALLKTVSIHISQLSSFQ